ncbi:MAG: nucleotidyl transferase AbiEii/AbiGii toxin family protein [Deltaproteobacteria bacterium]|nr:nucleotidyl transferase AbiEii/AbiGii toxin family protein [Deltaproteobacteria bacterium]
MDDLFAVFVSRLDQAGIESMIVGSVAAMAYGEPRLTNDIDLVVTLQVAEIPALVAAFPDELFYCAPAEVVRVEILRGHRGHFNIIHHETGFRADVYIAGRDPLHRWAMQRRRRLHLGSQALSVAPPEYVIVRKLEFYREGGSEKHVHDIRRMLEASGAQIDTEQLQSMIIQRGLDDLWALVRAATD